MAKSLEIPQDIIDNIIAAVGDDTRSLKQCTLVSSSFLRPSRKQLFSAISIGSHRTCQGIYQFLIQNPTIQSFVRAITIKDTHNLSWMNGTSLLPAILQLPFCCLECFSIIARNNSWEQNPLGWKSSSSELKDALSNIILSSTLKTLSLTGIIVPISTLFPRTLHLQTLKLYSFLPMDFGDENSSPLVAQMASRRVIERCVWHLPHVSGPYLRSKRFPSSAHTSLIQDRKGPTESKFLPFLCGLRFFEIYTDLGSAALNSFDYLSFMMGSLYISLTSPPTLEHLEINIRFRYSYFRFHPSKFIKNLRGAFIWWRHLDSISTHPAGSRLQRVDINIDYSFRPDVDGQCEPVEGEVVGAILDGLPLLRAKGILFAKARPLWDLKLTLGQVLNQLRIAG